MTDPGAAGESNPGSEAELRARTEIAEQAAETAQDAAQQAEQAAESATGAADQAEHARVATERLSSEIADELASEDFLRDTRPNRDVEHAYGAPGAPLRGRSPFLIGFAGAAGALLAFWLAQQILAVGSILLLIVVAMFLAVGLNPSVEFFMRRGASRGVAVLIVISLVLVALVLFFVALVPVITDQVATLVKQGPSIVDSLKNNSTVENLNQKFGVVDQLQAFFSNGDFGKRVFGGVVGVGAAVLSAVANTFIVIVLMLYFLASLPGIKRFFYRVAPQSRRERVSSLGDQILANVGAYVSGAFIVALCAGVSSLVFLLIVGLGAYALALAAIVFLLDVIPMIGATIGAVIVTAIGFATEIRIGIACVIFFLVYQQVENYLIYPRVMARSVDIPGSLIVVAALVGTALLGVVGALLAIPTAAALQLITKQVLLPRQEAH